MLESEVCLLGEGECFGTDAKEVDKRRAKLAATWCASDPMSLSSPETIVSIKL